MRGRSTIWLLILSLPLAAMTVEGRQPAESGRALVERHLREDVGFSASDWRNVLEGRPVARPLRMDDGRDVSIYGAVRLPGTPGMLADWIRRIDAFERKLDVIGVGRFEAPPRLDDLAGLTLPPQDLDDLRKCRPGDCELQLPARAMSRLLEQVDWKSPDAEANANRLFRELMFDQLRAYRVGGAEALPPYVDRDPPTSIAEESARLYHPDDTPVAVPELVTFLKQYPRAALPGADSFFYWNQGDFGMKATTRLNQVVIYPLPPSRVTDTGVEYVIATQQVYANHYFSATLELRTLVRDDMGDEPGFFLLYATRSRVPGLSGFIGTLLRPIVRGRARSGMEKYLGKTAALFQNQGR